MKRRLFLPFFIFALCVALSTATFAANTETQAADALYELGLFKGTGTNSDGTPIYSLEKTPSRAEAITMLVRLLGKEKEATAKTWETPFTDVDAWAAPYVGYAFNNGLTNGTSATTFGSNQNSNATQYLSFVLRSLGYSDKSGDFAWDKAWELTDELGITNGEYGAKNSFNRGNVAQVSLEALSAELKDSDKTLSDKLISEGVYTEETYKKALAASDTRNSAENVAKYKYAWSNQYNGYLITGFSGAGCENIILPSEYNGKPVVGLEKAALHGDSNNSSWFHPVSLNIPKTFVTIGPSNYFNIPTYRLEKISVETGNSSFIVKDGWLLTKDGKTTMCVCGAKEGTYTLPDGVEALTCAVLHMNADKLVIPASLKSYHYIEHSHIKEFVVAEDNPYFCAIDAVLFSKDCKSLVQYPEGKESAEYHIPSSVTKICEFAFRSNELKALKDLYVPKSVRETGENPFNGLQGNIHIEGETDGWDETWSRENRCNYLFGDEALTYKPLPYIEELTTAEGFTLYGVEYAELPDGKGYYVKVQYDSDYKLWATIYNCCKQEGDEGYEGGLELSKDDGIALKYFTKEDFESYEGFALRIRNTSGSGASYGNKNHIYIYPNGIPDYMKQEQNI
ncbi:MAG: hypothetical protein Q3995_00985 [Eubacteriales bacterium]|nr:hypothetical protein [Eubacteriales bacterium]